MPFTKSGKEHAWDEADESLLTDFDVTQPTSQAPPRGRRTGLVIKSAIVTISLVLNFITILLPWWRTGRLTLKEGFSQSKYAGLQLDREIAWQHSSPYSNSNLTEAGKLWNQLQYDDGVIALDYKEAEELGLPKAQPFPWDQSKGIYFINAYHQLHCLKAIHQFIRETELDTIRSFKIDHIAHCLDTLRSDVVCQADDTPHAMLPGYENFGKSGVDQPRQCRDFSKLERWAKAHHTCFSRIDETYQCKNQMERYKFCPEGCPYQGIMHAYFREVMGRELPLVVPKEEGQAGMCGPGEILGAGFSGRPDDDGRQVGDGYGSTY